MKEKMKSILFVLALTLVFVGAARITEAAAAEGYSINYADETIMLNAVSGSAAYYQIVKDSEGSGVKAANWVPAALSSSKYMIDISVLSNTKDAYLAVAGDPTATEATYVIQIPVLVKSLKATLNYAKEDPSSIYSIISSIDLKGTTTANNVKWPVDTNKDKTLDSLTVLGWKRGANGSWKSAAEFTTVEWNMMKSASSTLYLRVEKLDADGSGTMDTCRFSKEVKVKIPKVAKAPTIKVDYRKSTVALKNGMQFRVAGSTDWITIGIKNTKATETAIYNVTETKTAIAAVSMGGLKAILGSAYEEGTKLDLEVRTTATSKKFASNIAKVSFVTPVAAPTLINSSVAGNEILVHVAAVSGSQASLTLKLKDNVTGFGEGFEYALAGADADLAKLKFVKVSADVDLTRKIGKTISYVNASGTKATVEYEKSTLYIRKATVTTIGSEAFASEILTKDLSK